MPGARGWLPVVIGTVLALASATKLNGALGALGLGVFAAVQQGQALLRTRRTLGLRSWIDVGLATVIVFVAVNPLLYVRPVDRIAGLIQHRQDEMELQRSVFSSQAVPDDLSSRIARVARRAFHTYATPRGPLPVSTDVVLVPLGLAVLGWRSAIDLRRGRSGPAVLFLCWFAATYVVVTPNLGFDSSHYFAPLVTLNTVASGVAIAATAWTMLGRAARHQRRPWAGPGQNVQAPTT
jgi:hypothetical protein